MSRRLIGVFAFVIATGCAQGDSPVAPGLRANSSNANAGLQSRPWSGSCAGTAAAVDASTLHIVATCDIAHLGRASVDAYETLSSTATGFVLTGAFTYIAANGDRLYTTSAGTATFKPDFSGVDFSGTETAVGGTGRFTNATGTATRAGSTRFSDGTGSWVNSGTLSYDASDRN